MKKVLSVVLALMLVVAMAAPAFATVTTPGSQEITDPAKLMNGVTNKVTGTTSVGVLKITVPTTNAVVLNPYGLSLKVSATGTEDASGTQVTDQVISPAQAIKSESTSNVKVSAIVTGNAGGNVKFATASLASDTTTKTNSVFLNFVAAAPDATGVTAGSELTAITPAVTINVGTKASVKTELGTLPAGDTAAQYLPFQLQGDAVQNPTTPWTTKDTVGASIAFSFDLVAGGGGTTVTASMSPSTLSLDSSTNSTGSLTVSLSGGVNVQSVSWSSSNTSAATVGNGTGATETVTYAGAGSTTITATVTGDDGQTYTATCSVTCS